MDYKPTTAKEAAEEIGKIVFTNDVLGMDYNEVVDVATKLIKEVILVAVLAERQRQLDTFAEYLHISQADAAIDLAKKMERERVAKYVHLAPSYMRNQSIAEIIRENKIED